MSEIMEEIDEDEIAINKDVMKQQAFGIASEHIPNDNIISFLDDEVYENMTRLWDLKDNVEHVDVYPSDDIEEYSICFSGEAQSHRSRLVNRRTHWNPAEYETETVELFFVLTYYPVGDGGLGDAELEIEHL